MPGVQALNFDSPEETRTPEKTGWMWSEPGPRPPRGWCWSRGGAGRSASNPSRERTAAKRDTSGLCSRDLLVTHDDGSEAELRAGEAYVIEPGHNAHVVGDQQFIAYEFNRALLRSTHAVSFGWLANRQRRAVGIGRPRRRRGRSRSATGGDEVLDALVASLLDRGDPLERIASRTSPKRSGRGRLSGTSRTRRLRPPSS